MRIYMMTDLEGVSGINDIAYMDQASDFYRSARELLTGDVNAAIAGCFDGGATEVLVRDGHSTGNNILTEKLDPRVVIDKGRQRWTASLDETFDAAMMIGQHAMAGTLDGFLDHTMSSASWFSYSINDKLVGEIGMWATMAGHFKVPLVYLAGDEAGCAEAEELLPGIVTTAVKRGVGRNRAMGMAPSRAHECIRQDVSRALRAKEDWPKPLVWKKPMTIRQTMYRSDQADGRDGNGVERIDARTLQKKTRSQIDIRI